MNYRFKTKPYDHQLKALRDSWAKEHYAYFMEMGTGKSKVLIDNIALLYDNGAINGALIIAPKGVYRNWYKNEIPTHLPDHIYRDVACWSSTPNKQDRMDREALDEVNGNLKIFLMNIEAFATDRGRAEAAVFLNSHRAMMAIDESTTIKNPKAKRTKAVIRLRPLARFRRILTGSPVTKAPEDLYAQCEFLTDEPLGFSSYYSFQARYCIMKRINLTGAHSFNKVIGYHHLEELKTKMDDFAYRVTKDECLDLPDKVYVRREIEMTKEQSKAYNTMKEFALAEINNQLITAAGVLAQIVKLHQVCCGHVLDENGNVQEVKNNRLQSLLDTLEECHGKIIIWAVYRHDIQTITTAIEKLFGQESVASFYGDTPDQERQEIVSRFMDTESPLRFFVANPATGGYGLTLTVANTVIYYSNSYDLEKRLQSEDRAHRIGQKHNVTYIDFMIPETVDERIVKALRNKIDIASSVMGEEAKEWLM